MKLKIKSSVLKQRIEKALIKEARFSPNDNQFLKIVNDELKNLYKVFAQAKKQKGQQPSVQLFNLMIKQALDQGGRARQAYETLVAKLEQIVTSEYKGSQDGENWWHSRNIGAKQGGQKQGKFYNKPQFKNTGFGNKKSQENV